MVAVVSLLVSLTTSWRFFDSVLHIPTTNGERLIVFGVAELALVVCGAGMALNVRRHGRPGSFRAIVWAMCAAMAYMAWAMSPIEEAIGRILSGPCSARSCCISVSASSSAPITSGQALSPASAASCVSGACHGWAWPTTDATPPSAPVTARPTRRQHCHGPAGGHGHAKPAWSVHCWPLVSPTIR